MGEYGSQSMIAPLRKVLVKRPGRAFAGADPARWHYTARPDLDAARREHDAFVQILVEAGAEVFYHDEPQPERADAIYVYDPAIVTDRGAIVLRMGKEQRRGEEEPMALRLEELGVPVLATLHGEALAEGGDLLWVDRHTLAAGLGFRTNPEGVRQLGEALEAVGVKCHAGGAALFRRSRCLPAPDVADQHRGRETGGDLPAPAVGAVLAGAVGAWLSLCRGAAGGIRDDGAQRAGAGAGALPDAGGQSDHAAAAGGSRLRGADLPGARDIAQGRGRADLPDPADPARGAVRGTRHRVAGQVS